MLVLTRKTGQKLIIDDDIEVVVLETRGETVKIGINAPKAVQVFREELYTEIKNSNLESKSASADSIDKLMDIFKVPTAKPDVNTSVGLTVNKKS